MRIPKIIRRLYPKLPMLKFRQKKIRMGMAKGRRKVMPARAILKTIMLKKMS